MLIKWSDIHSVNVKEFDEQHKKLVEIINELFAHGATNKEALVLIVKKLIEYANYHLEAEEFYFEKFGYEDSTDHIKKHDFYRQTVADFEKEILETDSDIAFKKLTDFLRDWWINHINQVDQEYVDFFNKQGLY